MCWFFHKWETKYKHQGTTRPRIKEAFSTTWRLGSEEPVIARIQRCKKCNEWRAFVSTFDGTVQEVDPEFILENYQEKLKDK